MRLGEVRDCNVFYLMRKEFIPAWEMVKNVASQTAIFAPGTLSVGWSAGSPSYSALPSSRVGGIRMASTVTQVDHLWRVPSAVDKNHPIYFRYHWSAQIAGATPTVEFNQWIATLSNASSLSAVSPTSAVNTQAAASTNGGSGSLLLNITGRAAIAPLATGLAAGQVMADAIEMLHITIQPVSTNWAIASLPLWFLGMDVEYTPRLTYGDGSRQEAVKMETNLGFQRMGAANDY